LPDRHAVQSSGRGEPLIRRDISEEAETGDTSETPNGSLGRNPIAAKLRVLKENAEFRRWVVAYCGMLESVDSMSIVVGAPGPCGHGFLDLAGHVILHRR
jgi:hypothetical protein